MKEMVFFFDVDNTLLDNDRVINDLREFLEKKVAKYPNADILIERIGGILNLGKNDFIQNK